MTVTMMDRAREFGVTIQVGPAKRVQRNNAQPEDNYDGWDHDRYRVKLTSRRPAANAGGRQELKTVFRKGTGHNGSPPALDEVLDGLVNDACCYQDSKDFPDFCENFGIDLSTGDAHRRAVRMWEACKRTRADLIRLVGEEGFNTLVHDTERL